MGLFDRLQGKPAPKPSLVASNETSANVSPHQLVELFNAEGLPTYVPDSDVESWLRHGLSRNRYDVGAEVEGIGLLFDSARRAVLEHIAATRSNGAVQREAEAAVAQAAFSELTAGYGRLMHALERGYPHRESAGVEMHSDTETIRVDPSQVDHYRAQGFRP